MPTTTRPPSFWTLWSIKRLNLSTRIPPVHLPLRLLHQYPIFRSWSYKDALTFETVQKRLRAVGNWRNHTAVSESTLEVLLQLMHCGFLSNVEKMIEDLDNGDVDCWPGLRRLALYQECSFGQNCEQEVLRVGSTNDDKLRFWSKLMDSVVCR